MAAAVRQVAFEVDEFVFLPRARAVAARTRNCNRCGVRMYPDPRGEAFKRQIVAAWKDAVRDSAWATLPSKNPIHIVLDLSRPLPPSAPKRRIGEPDTYKPDVDNAIKQILDSLNGLAYVDDSQVVEIHAVKKPRYPGTTPKTRVVVTELQPDYTEPLFEEGDA